MCFDFFYNVYLNLFLIPQAIHKEFSDIIKILRSLCKVPDILSDINQTWIFLTNFNESA